MGALYGCLVLIILYYSQHTAQIKKFKTKKNLFLLEKDLYLEKKKDGTYILHIGRTVEKISKKDIEKGLYNSYPIIEER